MSIQYIALGATPCEEECAQVGRPDYPERSKRECQVYQRMLERLYPAPNDQVRLVIKSSSHDFGNYREVCARFDDEDEPATDYAYELERESPTEWDAIARYELLWLERRDAFQRAAARGEITRDEIPAPYRSPEFPALPADKTLTELCALFPF
jgi:hypothetical protein